MKAKIISLIIFYLIISFSIHAQIANCDPTVPVFYIDFTSAITDSTWISPAVTRSGNCCTSVPPAICVLFVITTGTNTAALVFSMGNCPLPNGSIVYQVDCGPGTNWTDTTIITTPGIHYLTYCKPGNVICNYSITSLAQIPTGLNENTLTYSTLIRDFSGNYFLSLNLTSPQYFVLNIFSSDGKNILEQKFHLVGGQHTIPLSTKELAQGVYFCSVKGDTIDKTFKFIK